MRKIGVGQTGIAMSAVGLGCVGLTTMPRVEDALALLGRAFDLGITHFDTARSYGAGFSEEILGDFARGRRADVTIATKFGLQTSPLVVGNRRFVAAVKRGLKLVPALDRLVRRQIATPPADAYQYSPQKCRESLERSLQVLRSDYVDFLFLHNAHRSDAEHDDLIDTAGRLVEQGKIRAFGISASVAYVGDDLDSLPAIFRVAQGDHGVVGGARWKNGQRRGIISFATQNALRPITAALAADPGLARRWSDAIGEDAADIQVIARLLVEVALDANRDGGVLVGTKNLDHLATAASAATGSSTPAALTAFRKLADDLWAERAA